VPQTSSQAISAAILPYVLRLAQENWREDRILASGINIAGGELVHPALKGMQL
jgi:alanine dehydrogenase